MYFEEKKTPSKHTTNNKNQSIWHHGASCLEFETDRARVPTLILCHESSCLIFITICKNQKLSYCTSHCLQTEDDGNTT